MMALAVLLENYYYCFTSVNEKDDKHLSFMKNLLSEVFVFNVDQVLSWWHHECGLSLSVIPTHGTISTPIFLQILCIFSVFFQLHDISGEIVSYLISGSPSVQFWKPSICVNTLRLSKPVYRVSKHIVDRDLKYYLGKREGQNKLLHPENFIICLYIPVHSPHHRWHEVKWFI